MTEQRPEPMLRHFSWVHLPEGPMRAMSAQFALLAQVVCDRVPGSAERTVTLRKLLEAKDAAVRCVVDELRGLDPTVGARSDRLDSPDLARGRVNDPGMPPVQA